MSYSRNEEKQEGQTIIFRSKKDHIIVEKEKSNCIELRMTFTAVCISLCSISPRCASRGFCYIYCPSISRVVVVLEREREMFYLPIELLLL